MAPEETPNPAPEPTPMSAAEAPVGRDGSGRDGSGGDGSGGAAPPSGPSPWDRLRERSEPFASEVFAAGAALLITAGVATIGGYAGKGANNFSGTWPWIWCLGLFCVAFLAELRAPRPYAAACTTMVVAASALWLFFLRWPYHSYSDVRLLEILVALLWLVIFAIGGTRGRAVFLGLAAILVWSVAIGQAAGIEHSFSSLPFAPGNRLTALTGVPGTADSSGFQTTPPDFQLNNNQLSDGSTAPPVDYSPPKPHDRRLAIGFTADAFAALFLWVIWAANRRGRHALATALVFPAVDRKSVV
jgi:hypothetical protein